MTYATAIISFLKGLSLDLPAAAGVEVLNPYQNQRILGYCKKFYRKYYDDTHPRTLLMGINPGRFGGGLTGIPFTDPIKLKEQCAIDNTLPQRAELSGDFIYRVIAAYGGEQAFYKHFYFSSVSPLGFTREGKNLNYYDLKWLQDAIYSFVVAAMRQQLRFGLNTQTAFCLGRGKNYAFLNTLNQRFNFFDKIVPLPHPRFVMQYRRKQVDTHVQAYIEALTAL